VEKDAKQRQQNCGEDGGQVGVGQHSSLTGHNRYIEMRELRPTYGREILRGTGSRIRPIPMVPFNVRLAHEKLPAKEKHEP